MIVTRRELDNSINKIIRNKLRTEMLKAYNELPTDKYEIIRSITCDMVENINKDLTDYYKCFANQGEMIVFDISPDEYADILLGK